MEEREETSLPHKTWRQRLSPHTLYNHTKTQLLTTHHHNLHTLRTSPLSEISGSLGDLGTLLPLLIALANAGAISLPATLVFSGLANILTGITFGIPLPVQPMKAIAAIALASSLSLPAVMSAGIFVALAILFLTITGALQKFTTAIPIPIIKGIQIGTGLSLILTAPNLFPSTPLNNLVFLLAFIGLLATHIFPTLPYALLILLAALLYEILSITPPQSDEPNFHLYHPSASLPSPRDFRTGILSAGLGQLPLTTLNSIIAVCHLAHDLYPPIPPSSTTKHRPPKPPSPTALGLSVALINLLGCPFGAMPICHGSGGLAAQHRFGARSGASVVILGLVKLVLGLFAGGLAKRFCERFPGAGLAVLMLAAGGGLVGVGEGLNTSGARDLRGSGEGRMVVDGGVGFSDGSRDGVGETDGGKEEERPVWGLSEEERKRRWAVCFMTVAGILAFRNDAVGFAAGGLTHWSFWARDWWVGRVEGRVRLEEGGVGNGEEREGEETGAGES